MLPGLRTFRRRSNPGAASMGSALRHCDWRFLLPMPPGGTFAHLVLLGGAEGLAEMIVSAGLAKRVSEETPATPCADALIILHRSEASPQLAKQCLLPGGVVYWEVDRRRSGRALVSVESALRSLRASGISPNAVYWVRPGFARPQIYLPLGDGGVLRWYLRNFYTSTALKGRVHEMLLRVLSGLGVRMQRGLIPAFAVTAVSGGSRTAPSVLSAPDFRPELWRSVRRQHGGGWLSDPDVLLLTKGDDDWNRVVAMPFSRGARDPIAVLKLSRVAERNVYTEAEQVVLSEIRRSMSDDMRRTVPEALGTFAWKDLTVGVESYVSGRLLAATSAGWGVSLRRKIEDLDLAVDWLIELDLQTEMRRVRWSDPELVAWSTKPLDVYASMFGTTSGEKSLFEMARQRHRELGDAAFPIVWYHYAFSSWNIYRHNDGIAVFDWESAERGPALFDLIYLVSRWHQELGRGRGRNRHRRALRQLFLDAPAASAPSRAIQEAIRRYMTALKIDPRAFPVVLVALWTFHATTHARRARQLGGAGTDVRQGNAYVDYLGVLAEEADRLFERW